MGDCSHISARSLARASGLFLIGVDEAAVVRLRDGVLELGPGACDGAIATIAVRRLLRAHGLSDERDVQRLVESYGYGYLAEGSGTVYRAVS
jgi:hypothetical protein